jgi:ABC-type Fe3+-hydroxamate transport system substrate-binding protein
MHNFDILDTYTGYDDQYLYLEAKTSKKSASPVLRLEESVEELKRYVDEFVIKINEELGKWEKLLLRMKDENKKVVIWGGGSKSVGFLTHFNDLNIIKHVVDLNPYMQGNYIPSIGMQYVAPEFLRTYKPDIVIIMNGIYENEIRKMLMEMGLTPELVCL